MLFRSRKRGTRTAKGNTDANANGLPARSKALRSGHGKPARYGNVPQASWTNRREGRSADDESARLCGEEKPLKREPWTWQQGEINLQTSGWVQTVEGVRNAEDGWLPGVGSRKQAWLDECRDEGEGNPRKALPSGDGWRQVSSERTLKRT